MPTSERRSKTFRDINLSFKRHPVTNDLVTIKNEDAIKRSVYNIVQTIFGEKPHLYIFSRSLASSWVVVMGFSQMTLKLFSKRFLAIG